MAVSSSPKIALRVLESWKRSGVRAPPVSAKSSKAPMPTSQTLVQVAPIEPRLLAVKDAAKYLGCTVCFVRSLGRAKELPIIRLGKKFCFDKADLDKWIEKQKAG